MAGISGISVIADLESPPDLFSPPHSLLHRFLSPKHWLFYPERKTLHALNASARRVGFEAGRIPVTQASPGKAGSWTLWHHSYTTGPDLRFYGLAEWLRPFKVRGRTRLGAGSGTKRKTPDGLTQPVAVADFRWSVSSIRKEVFCAHGHSNIPVISTMTSTPQSLLSSGMTEQPSPSQSCRGTIAPG